MNETIEKIIRERRKDAISREIPRKIMEIARTFGKQIATDHWQWTSDQTGIVYRWKTALFEALKAGPAGERIIFQAHTCTEENHVKRYDPHELEIDKVDADHARAKVVMRAALERATRLAEAAEKDAFGITDDDIADAVTVVDDEDRRPAKDIKDEQKEDEATDKGRFAGRKAGWTK